MELCSLLCLIPALLSLGKRDHSGSCPSLLPSRPVLPHSRGSRLPLEWEQERGCAPARGSHEQLCQMFQARSKSPGTGGFRVSGFGSGLGHRAKFIK